MKIITVSALRKNIYNIIKNVIKTHEPVTITDRNSNEAVVLISQKDWEDIKETMFIYSNKNAHNSIISSLNEPY